jgi:hypothetical protein
MAMTATKWPMAKRRKLGTFREMNVCFQGRRSLTTAMGWVSELAESMTGWLTVADDGGGGATVVSSSKRAGWDASNAMLTSNDYVGLFCL